MDEKDIWINQGFAQHPTVISDSPKYGYKKVPAQLEILKTQFSHTDAVAFYAPYAKGKSRLCRQLNMEFEVKKGDLYETFGPAGLGYEKVLYFETVPKINVIKHKIVSNSTINVEYSLLDKIFAPNKKQEKINAEIERILKYSSEGEIVSKIKNTLLILDEVQDYATDRKETFEFLKVFVDRSNDNNNKLIMFGLGKYKDMIDPQSFTSRVREVHFPEPTRQDYYDFIEYRFNISTKPQAKHPYSGEYIKMLWENPINYRDACQTGSRWFTYLAEQGEVSFDKGTINRFLEISEKTINDANTTKNKETKEEPKKEHIISNGRIDISSLVEKRGLSAENIAILDLISSNPDISYTGLKKISNIRSDATLSKHLKKLKDEGLIEDKEIVGGKNKKAWMITELVKRGAIA
jgi:DNA-binding transcriptional ArsR family regulator